ncbi:DUF3618 domain-containing protein [Pseudahrensia aquimaris]|uniref:DUF3618 domain-containing protein n=1 Tax=Pseudahrensia aquimaris TaxID=744461 RepID=A0ABW3FFW4_9HYPH
MTHSPEMIEDQIEQTRKRIDARLNSLSHQLNPSELFQQAIGSKSSDPAQIAEAAISKAKENPFGALLFGAGLASLLTGKPNLAETISTPDMEQIKAEASAKKAKLSAKVENAKDVLAETSAKARNTAKRSPTLVRGKAEGVVDWVADNPVASGLMAVAVGAAVSSIFASRPNRSRLEASEELHDIADAEQAPRQASKKAAPVKKTSAKRKPANKAKPSKASVAAIERSTAVLGENTKSARG